MKYLQMACFRSEWILIEQRELGQTLIEIDIEVGVGLTWRGMVEIVCIPK